MALTGRRRRSTGASTTTPVSRLGIIARAGKSLDRLNHGAPLQEPEPSAFRRSAFRKHGLLGKTLDVARQAEPGAVIE